MTAACLLRLLLWAAAASWAAAQLQADVLVFPGFSAEGVALDGSGRLFCSDYFGNRIAVFNASTGRALSVLNASDTLVAPTGLAWDPVYGGLIVANANEFQWLRLSVDGLLQPLFPLNQSLGSPWTSREWPGGVAVDGSSGALVFGYYWSGIVEKYAADGTLLWRQYAYSNDSWGAYTRGIAIDAAGDVWVADWLGSRVIHFSSDGERLAVYSSALLLSPQGLAFDAAGALVIASYASNEVLKFSVSEDELSLLQAFSTSSPSLSSPAGLAIDSSGNVWCGDTGNSRVVQFAASGSLQLQVTDDESVELTALSVLYVPAIDSLIVAVYAQLWFVALDGTVGAQLTFSDPLQVDDPGGLAVAASGAVLLASPRTNQLLQIHIDPQGGPNSSWSVFASFPAVSFFGNSSPAVAVDAAGRVYVSNTYETSTAPAQVLMLSDTAVLQAAFTTSDPPLDSPAGVAVLPDGSLLYTADKGNDRVVRWTTAVNRTAPSQVWTNISQPYGLVVDPAGNVFVASMGSVYQLLPNGSVALACSPAPPPDNQPMSDSQYTTFLTVDRSGLLYLADWFNNRVVVCPAAAPAPTVPSSPSSSTPPVVTSSPSSVSSVTSTGASSIVLTSPSSSASSSARVTVSSAASVATATSSVSISPPSSSSSSSSPSAIVSSSTPAPSSSSSSSSAAWSSSSTRVVSASAFLTSSSFSSSQLSSSVTGKDSSTVTADSSSRSASTSPSAPRTGSSASTADTSQLAPSTSASSSGSIAASPPPSTATAFLTSSPELAATPTSGGGGLAVGAIIGIAVAAAALVCCLLICAVYSRSGSRQHKRRAANTGVEVVTYTAASPSAVIASHSHSAAAEAAAESPVFSYDTLYSTGSSMSGTASTIHRSQIVLVY